MHNADLKKHGWNLLVKLNFVSKYVHENFKRKIIMFSE